MLIYRKLRNFGLLRKNYSSVAENIDMLFAMENYATSIVLIMYRKV